MEQCGVGTGYPSVLPSEESQPWGSAGVRSSRPQAHGSDLVVVGQGPRRWWCVEFSQPGDSQDLLTRGRPQGQTGVWNLPWSLGEQFSSSGRLLDPMLLPSPGLRIAQGVSQ